MKPQHPTQPSTEKWDICIQPHTGFFSFNFSEVWRYKDLIFLFVWRDFVTEYKQTILGPLWYLMQPIFTAITFLFILNKMGNVPTDGIPPLLFYLSGITIWTYFATCLVKISESLITYSDIFKKVYFPRLIVPISLIISNLIKFGLQLMLLIFFIGFFSFKYADFNFSMTSRLLLLPLPVFLMAGLSFSFGLVVSSLTTKYKDLKFALEFGVQLLMYASAVILSLNSIPLYYRNILKWNPMASVVELFRSIIFANHPLDTFYVTYSIIFLIVSLFVGLLIFNKFEKSFIDTI